MQRIQFLSPQNNLSQKSISPTSPGYSSQLGAYSIDRGTHTASSFKIFS